MKLIAYFPTRSNHTVQWPMALALILLVLLLFIAQTLKSQSDHEMISWNFKILATKSWFHYCVISIPESSTSFYGWFVEFLWTVRDVTSSFSRIRLQNVVMNICTNFNTCFGRWKDFLFIEFHFDNVMQSFFSFFFWTCSIWIARQFWMMVIILHEIN